MKRMIYCFAKDKGTLLYELERKSESLIKHLVKYFMYPGHISASHWGDEIYAFLNSVSKLKKKNKRPTSKQILQSTWDVYEDSIIEYIPTVVDDYGDSDIDPELVYNNCRDYMIWLSNMLSDVGSVSRKACKRELETIEMRC